MRRFSYASCGTWVQRRLWNGLQASTTRPLHLPSPWIRRLRQGGGGVRASLRWPAMGPHCTPYREYFVKFRETPNTSCYRFEVPGRTFLISPDVSSMSFTRENSHHSPLAAALLTALPMVEEVTLGYAFVTVRKVSPTEAVNGAKAFADYFSQLHGESIQKEEEAMRKAAAMENGGPSPYADAIAADKTPKEKSMIAEEGTPARDDMGKEDGASSSPPTEPPLEEEAIASMISNTSWEDLKMHISALLTDFLYSGLPSLSLDAPPPHQDTIPEAGDSEVLLSIKELVRTAIRPLLQEDGGDIRLDGFQAESGVMRVEFLGACRRCHSRHHTLTDLIERTTQHWIPEVRLVVAVEEPSLSPREALPSTRESKTATQSRRRTGHASEGDHSFPPHPIVASDEAPRRSDMEGKGGDEAGAECSDPQNRCVDVKHSKACLRLEGNARLIRHVEQKPKEQLAYAPTSL